MRISDWSSDVCSSDLVAEQGLLEADFVGIDSFRAKDAAVARLRIIDRCGQDVDAAGLESARPPDISVAVIDVVAQCRRWHELLLDGVRVGFDRLQEVRLIAFAHVAAGHRQVARSEAMRVGKECVSTVRYRW